MAVAVLVSMELAAASTAGGVGLPAHQAALLRSEAQHQAAVWIGWLGDAARTMGQEFRTAVGQLDDDRTSPPTSSVWSNHRVLPEQAAHVRRSAALSHRQARPLPPMQLAHLFLPPPRMV